MESLTWVCVELVFAQTNMITLCAWILIHFDRASVNRCDTRLCVLAHCMCARTVYLRRWKKNRDEIERVVLHDRQGWHMMFFAVVVLVDVDVKIFISRWIREYGSNQCIAIFGASLRSSILLTDFAMRAKLSRHKFERVTWHRSHETAIVLALIQSLHCTHTLMLNADVH